VSSALPLLPGLIVGVMLLLISAVSLIGNDKAILVRQIADDQADGSTLLTAVASTLRIAPWKSAAGDDGMLIESATQSLAKAQGLLSAPNLLTAADRVTLSISLMDSGSNKTGFGETGRQLAQVLSRRLDALELRAVIRVSRAEDLTLGLDLAESMLAGGTLSADQIAIGIDTAVKSDTIAIEILRSILLSRLEEPLR